MRTPTLAAVALVLLIGGPRPGRSAGTPAPRFQIAFLRQDSQSLGLSNAWEADWPRLQAAAANPLLLLDERDVVAYDAETLRIVLRPAVTPRLLAAVQALPGLPEWPRKLKALWSTGELNMVLDERGFVVSLDGRPLYGGIVLRGTERIIHYPTLDAAMDGDRHIVLHLSFPALAIPVKAGAVEPYERLLRDPRLQKLFAARGTPEHPPSRPKAPAKRVAASIPLNVMPWPLNGRMKLYFRPASREKIAEIRCRLADPSDSPWIVADSDLGADLGTPGHHRVEVEVFGLDGAALGTYSFFLDPQDEELRFRKKILTETANGWVELGDREEWKEKTLYFAHLVSYKEALREVRYSLDSCALDRRFPLSPPAPGASPHGIGGDKLYENVPKTVGFACVQLVYRDGETTEPRRFYNPLPPPAGTPEPAVAGSPAPLPGPAPVTLHTQRSNIGWLFNFQIAARHTVRDIRYRFAPDSEWRSTGTDSEINLLSGQRSPSTEVAVDPLRVTPGRHRVDVKLVDWKGGESGPYALWFDPAAEVLLDAKENLRGEEIPWATFSGHLGQAQIFFPLLSYKDAFREIRYSFDTCDLDRKFPFDPWTDLTQPPKMTEKKGYVDMPAKTSFVCVQFVFRDGEVTEPRRFAPDT